MSHKRGKEIELILLMFVAAVTTSTMADTQTETPANTCLSEANAVNHESEGDSTVFLKKRQYEGLHTDQAWD